MALSLERYSSPWMGSHLSVILKERNKMEQERSTVITTNIGDGLHESLIMEILSWLPVKWLLHYKIVCKSWYAMISSPDFISKHLKNYYHNNNSPCLLALYWITPAELRCLELLVDDEMPRVLAHEVLYDMPIQCSVIDGPCHGIYYLYDYTFKRRAFWNPVTNELKVLPPITTPNLPRACTYDVHGFGFDSLSGDYKAVALRRSSRTDDDDSEALYNHLSVLVYSLRTDSWRYCGRMKKYYEVEINQCYMFANGCTYWLGSCPEYEVIICFDFSADAVSELCVPNYDKPASQSIGLYRDSVAFFTAGYVTDEKFNIWTLNDKGFWTKVLTIGPIPNLLNIVGHWRNDKVILEVECCSTKAILCDTNTQEVWDLGFVGYWGGCKGVFAYRESLVSLKDIMKSGSQQERVINGDQG